MLDLGCSPGGWAQVPIPSLLIARHAKSITLGLQIAARRVTKSGEAGMFTLLRSVSCSRHQLDSHPCKHFHTHQEPRKGLVVGVDLKRTLNHCPIFMPYCLQLILPLEILTAVQIEIQGFAFLQLDLSNPDALPAIEAAMKQVHMYTCSVPFTRRFISKILERI